MSCPWVHDERPRAPTLAGWMRGCMSATTTVFGAGWSGVPGRPGPGLAWQPVGDRGALDLAADNPGQAGREHQPLPRAPTHRAPSHRVALTVELRAHLPRPVNGLFGAERGRPGLTGSGVAVRG